MSTPALHIKLSSVVSCSILGTPPSIYTPPLTSIPDLTTTTQTNVHHSRPIASSDRHTYGCAEEHRIISLPETSKSSPRIVTVQALWKVESESSLGRGVTGITTSITGIDRQQEMDPMDYIQDPGYQPNAAANRQRQCDPSPLPFNYNQPPSFQVPRSAYSQPYDPVHDHSTYNAPGNANLQQNNNGFSQGGFSPHGFSPAFHPNPAMSMSNLYTATGSNGSAVNQNPYMSYPHMANVGGSNMNYPPYQSGSSFHVPFGAPTQALPVQNAPFFGYVICSFSNGCAIPLRRVVGSFISRRKYSSFSQLL